MPESKKKKTKKIDKILVVLDSLKKEIAKVMIGQEDVVEKALIVIFSGQHALVEGVPGLAKTLLIRTLGRVLSGDTQRIQFTPDLMPADITGTQIFNLQTNKFHLVKGPIFTTFLLADEINRAPAKTQSALLQAMQERSVSIDRTTHTLDPNFTVFATQNPIEHEGTYPLPEAQKDRFMMKITVPYPTLEDETILAERLLSGTSPEMELESGKVKPILTRKTLEALQSALFEILIKPDLLAYAVEIVRKTRNYESILVGAGPRATQSLLLASRGLAASRGRNFVTPDDIKAMAEPVLVHRLILRPEFEFEGLTSEEVIDRVLKEVKVPR